MKKCPVCKSSDVTLYMGGQFGKYQCKKCSYIGFVIDDNKNKFGKESMEILKDMKKHLKQ